MALWKIGAGCRPAFICCSVVPSLCALALGVGNVGRGNVECICAVARAMSCSSCIQNEVEGDSIGVAGNIGIPALGP